MRKTEIVNIRFTSAEYRAIRQEAKSCKMTVSAWIRAVVLARLAEEDIYEKD